MSVQTALKLDIGCGVYKREGYLGVDIDPICQPDICAPMWEIPLPDNSVDELYSSHALEHISKYRVVPVLKEWRRILKPGAKAYIEVPDLVWVCQNWLFRQTNDWHLDTIFGQATSEAEQHRTGFTPRIMSMYLNDAGLVLTHFEVVQSHGQDTLAFTVEKPL